jgi:hypothetical protein
MAFGSITSHFGNLASKLLKEAGDVKYKKTEEYG